MRKMNRNLRALIYGIGGQTCSYLAEILLNNSIDVVGIHRRSSVNNVQKVGHLISNPHFKLICGDITDASSCYNIVNAFKPTYLINGAAQSDVGISFDEPLHTTQVNYVGVLNLLETMRAVSPDTLLLQCSTSEQYGDCIDEDGFQREETPMRPNSPYAISKHAAHQAINLYRRAYNTRAICIINFNNESPRRGENFVTRKITKYVGRVVAFLSDTKLVNSKFVDDKDIDFIKLITNNVGKLKLGNLGASRDWSYSEDIAQGMYLALKNGSSDDYILSSGKTYTVKSFLDKAFSMIGFSDYTPFVEIDSGFYRKCEVPYLCGDSSKAHKLLGWYPKVKLDELVKLMVQHDIQEAQKVL
jgi:GDPmannose 4,6-dehydratase